MAAEDQGSSLHEDGSGEADDGVLDLPMVLRVAVELGPLRSGDTRREEQPPAAETRLLFHSSPRAICAAASLRRPSSISSILQSPASQPVRCSRKGSINRERPITTPRTGAWAAWEVVWKSGNSGGRGVNQTRYSIFSLPFFSIGTCR